LKKVKYDISSFFSFWAVISLVKIRSLSSGDKDST
jgi:hypothetical protein